MIHAEGSRSASLCREATRGNVSTRRNLRESPRRSDVAGNPLARALELNYHKQYAYQFSDKMVGKKYRYYRKSGKYKILENRLYFVNYVLVQILTIPGRYVTSSSSSS